MGYRMEVTDAVTGQSCYGTKLYGYYSVDFERSLPSLQFLLGLGRWEEDDEFEYPFFDYGCDNEIRLSASEFCKFIMLYCEDLQRCSDGGFFEDFPWKEILEGRQSDTQKYSDWWITNIAPIYQTKNDKILTWG